MRAGHPKDQWQLCKVKGGAPMDGNGIHMEWVENKLRGKLR